MNLLRFALVGIFSILVVVLSGMEILDEFGQGETLFEMSDDLAMFALGLVVSWIVGSQLLEQNSQIGQLKAQLASANSRLTELDARAPGLARQYRELMQAQFTAWKLSASEQEVVILLLKGLSFREIAAVRNTQEKTVRQQAASVYRKADLSGRHELAAWFLEDMLAPATPSTAEEPAD